MPCIGFSIQKGELHYCVLRGSREVPIYLDHGLHRFDPTQPRTALANLFKQTFKEVLDRVQPTKLAYRLSLDLKKADQFAYLSFPFGILNLIAYEAALPINEYVSQSFTKRALDFPGDKHAACDARIVNFPSAAKKETRSAALAAWMAL